MGTAHCAQCLYTWGLWDLGVRGEAEGLCMRWRRMLPWLLVTESGFVGSRVPHVCGVPLPREEISCC